jgi:hypothetical protein
MTYTVKYIDRSLALGFITNHVYVIEIKRTNYGYTVHATYDHTCDEKIDIYCPFASWIGVQLSFDLKDIDKQEVLI